MQLARFAKDYKAAVEGFNNVAALTLAGIKKFALPAAGQSADANTIGGSDKSRKGPTEDEARL